LRQEELLAALAAIHGGTPIPFGSWPGMFLHSLSAPTCAKDMVLVVAWESIEFTMARFNPLSTTYPMPGASDFNSVGVKNFTSLNQGIQATVRTLYQSAPALGYGPIVADLRRCADPKVTAEAINQSMYCGVPGALRSGRPPSVRRSEL
jgi:hypothetical protein